MKGVIGLAIGILLAVIVFIVNHFCYGMTFDGNSAGVLISALGVMVTALVGWQVYNAIEIRSIIYRVDKVKDGLDSLANEHRDKISRMEYLVSALHGTTFERKTYEGGDTAYFLHCLDVLGEFIKSGSPLNSPPFVNTIRNMESTFYDIKKRNDTHQIIILGSNKDFVRKWYHDINKIIDTEVQHLYEIKNRISNIYEEYIILTKDVIITPQKSSSITSSNTKQKKGLLCTLIDKLQRCVCGK